jgi:hypothetical protein
MRIRMPQGMYWFCRTVKLHTWKTSPPMSRLTYGQLLLKPLYVAKKINNWNPKIKFGFRDIKLETLDINPTGSTNAL